MKPRFSFYLLVLLANLLPRLVWGQCPTGAVILSNQAEVDAFPPGCVNLPGSLVIQGADISNLHSLSALQSIDGLLLIINNAQLSTLSGLNKLTSIGRDLFITNNAQLSTLSGLNKLTSIAGGVLISNNAQLSTLSGLNKLTSIDIDLIITNNAQLSTLSGLDNLTSIGHDLEINNNAQLSQCAITAICQYLANPPGSVNISGNAPGCQSQQEVQDNCTPLTITAQPPSSATVCVGATATASVATSGNVRSYQWHRNGQVVSGQTTATLSLTNVQPSEAGTYVVVVSNSVSSLTSTAFNLTVQQPTVSITPSAPAICAGQATTLAATPGLASYRWSTPNNGPVLTTPTISASVAGTYSLTGTTSQGCSATTSANVTVNPVPPTPSLTTQTGQLYPGGQAAVSVPQYSGMVTLLVSGCTGTLNWQGPNGTSGTTTSIPVATSATGTFVYQATCQLNGCTSAPGSATITVQAAALAMMAPLYDCASRKLTLRTTGGNGQPFEYHIASVTTGWETVSATFTVQDKHIGKSLKLRARQRSSSGGYVEVETSFTPTACGSGRQAVGEEPTAPLRVVVLGNPVGGEQVEIEVRGAEGQPLGLQLTNLQGRAVGERAIEKAGAIERQTLSLRGQGAGLMLLRVSTPGQSQTVKVLKSE